MKLKPYPKYKDSGIQWIGEIPEGWEARRIKMLSYVRWGASPRPIDDLKYFDDDGEYSWVRIADVTASDKYLLNTTEKLSKIGKSFSVPLEPGEIFISIAATVGKPVITKIKCCIHDGFVYFQRLKIDPDYLYYVFVGDEVYKGLGKLGTQLNLNTETIGGISIPTPLKLEQNAITNFLDSKTAKIDAMIEKDKKLITLLKEKRTALINHAVTKGLDPNVKLKDFGIEWIGEVPEGWSIRKLSHISDRISVGFVGTIEKYYTDEDEGIPLLKTGNVGFGKLRLENLSYVTKEFHILNKKSQLKPGDIVIARHGESGRSSVIPNNPKESNCLNIVLLKTGKRMSGAYYTYLLNSQLVQEHLQAIQGGAVQGVINTEDIAYLRFHHPPLSEQLQIVEYLDKATSKIDKIIKLIEQKVNLLQEYKKSCICIAT